MITSIDNSSTSSQKPQDLLVAALKHLGGVGHLREISAQCKSLGFAIPDPSIRRLIQQFSSDAIWTLNPKPSNTEDLFYSVDGVSKSTGFWGLRGFAVENPSAYPILGLKRSNAALLNRSETSLFNVRGIAYRDGKVVGIQVGFAPDSPYPDKLLPDGRIEHIGEGGGDAQRETGGNFGMLRAIETQEAIPVFQSVGLKGKKRYAELGMYRVASFEKRLLPLDASGIFTDAFVFILEPIISINRREPYNDISIGVSTDTRGGFESIILREISVVAPKPTGEAPVSSDPEVRRQALERRSNAHHALLLAFKKLANTSGLSCKCDQYADALCDGNIFEMKSLEGDEIAQVRAAIGQLYHYAFIHRGLDGYSSPELYAVFDAPIQNDLMTFIVEKVNIGVIWLDYGTFHGDDRTIKRLPWLFK